MFTIKRRWSGDEDLRFLGMSRAGVTRVEIGRMLKRSVDAIAGRKQQLEHEGLWQTN